VIVALRDDQEHPAGWSEESVVLPLPRQRPDDGLPTGRPVLYGSFCCPWFLPGHSGPT
jgi:hypothetical protein